MSHASLSTELALILACGHVHPRAQDIAAQTALVQAGVDWNYFLLLVHRHHVVSLIWKNLSTLAELHAQTIPPKVLEELKQAYQNNSFRVLEQAAEMIKLGKLLNSAGIPYFVLKGLPVALKYYGDPALRQAGDIDLLVAEADLARFQELLKQTDYQEEPLEEGLTEGQVYLYRKYLIHHAVYHHRHNGMELEVHWRLFTNPYLLPLDPLQMQYPERISLGSISLQAMSDEDVFIYMCLHGEHHGWEYLKWQFDLPQLLDARPNLGWEKLLSRAKSLGVTRSLHLGLFLVHRLYDRKLPKSVMREIESDPSVNARFKLVCKSMQRMDVQKQEKTFGEISSEIFHALRLRGGFKYKKHELLSNCFRPGDWRLIKLPDSLFPLYLLLRPLLMLGRRLQRSKMGLWM